MRSGLCAWAICIALAAILLLSGCGGLEIKSVWTNEAVKIDGVPAEWEGATTWVESPNVAVGVKNDDDYLYICLSSPVREVAVQIALRGFTVWLDPKGKKGKTFGIRCPIGPEMGTGNPGELRKLAEDREKFMETVAERLNGAGNVLEVLGPGEDDKVRLTPYDAAGLEVALGYQDGRVVYELKVPFRRDEHPYAIGSDGKGKIGIGFETPEIGRDERMAAMGGHRPEGGTGPGGGRTGGMTGGPPGGGRSGEMRRGGPGNMLAPLDIWAKISLASPSKP
jgi:hypothetical protein